jgi:PAS domain S-box-containing protein
MKYERSGPDLPVDCLGGDAEALERLRALRDDNNSNGAAPRAQESLPQQASESGYRRLFESSREGIMILDAWSGVVLDVNPSLLRLSGSSPWEILGRQVWNLESFKPIVADEEAFAELQRRDSVDLADRWLESRDGRRIDVEFVSNACVIDGQRLIQCNIRDITERKRAQAAERARFERAQLQLESIERISSSAALLEGDVERLAREITEEAARATGVERANVWLFNEDESELRCIDLYESSSGRHSAGMVLRQSEFANEFKALKDASFVVADDPLTDPRTAGYVDTYLVPLGITSMLDTVIEVADKHIGLLCLEHVGKPHAWQPDEIAFAGRLADKIPVAIASRIRKRGEEKIRALARFPDENPNPILRMSREGRVLYANPSSVALLELFQASAGEFANGPIVEHVRDRLASGETHTFETIHGGRIFSITIVPFPPEGHANIYGSDITDQKRAEAALLDSHALLTATERMAGVGGFDWDLKRDVLVWSKELYRIFGRDTDSHTPTIADIVASVPAQDRQRVESAIAASLSGESPLDLEHRIVRPDGTERAVHMQAEIQRDAAGKSLRMTGTVQDLTERKRAEETMLRAIGALKTLSNCNMALVHAGDEQSLLDEICRNIVVMAGYPLAWVALAEHDAEKTIRAVAYAGYINGFIERAGLTWDAGASPQGPVSAAILTRQPQLVQDAHNDPGYETWRESAIKFGYRSVLCLPLVFAGAAIGALCIYAADRDAFDDERIRLLSGLANELAFGIVTLRARAEHHRSAERLRSGMESTIEALAGTLELRDAYTAGHQRRVAELAAEIAREMGVTEDEVHGIHLAATVHDLGKIQVPAEILTKPTRLTNLEYEFVKTHAQAGYDLLKDIDFPWPIAQLVYQHHERLDGSGYPRGLRGEDTLRGAKILAVADTIEAMSSHRPYRAGLGIEASLAEITKNRDKLYDAAVVDACVKLFREKRFAFSTSAQGPMTVE